MMSATLKQKEKAKVFFWTNSEQIKVQLNKAIVIRVLLKTVNFKMFFWGKKIFMEMLSSKCILTLISLSVHLHRAHFAMDHY